MERRARLECSGPGVDYLILSWFTSFPDHGISGAKRECLDPGNLGSKKLQGKEI